MADAGVGEAALIAAAAESAAAASAAGATAAAVLPEVVAAAPVVAGGAATAAEAAATVAPTLALATPAAETAVTTAAPLALEAATVPTAAESLVAVGPEALTVPTAAEAAPTSLLPTTVPAATETPSVSLLATQSEPVTGGGLLGESFDPFAGNTMQTLEVAPNPTAYPADVSGISKAGGDLFAGQTMDSSQMGLLDKLGARIGNWWDTTSTGEKLKTAGSVLSAGQGAAKAATPTPTKGPSRTMQPGHVGQPRGGEQALAAVVEGLLKRRDAYLNAQGGVPIAYRPRSLLG